MNFTIFRRLSVQDRKLETGDISDGPRPLQKENWFRRNWERLQNRDHLLIGGIKKRNGETHFEDPKAFYAVTTRTFITEYLGIEYGNKGHSGLKEFERYNPKKHIIAQIVAFGSIGKILANIFQEVFQRYKFLEAILIVIGLGTIPAVTRKLWGKKPELEYGESKPRSFLSEFAEMHGIGFACAMPYYAGRLVAGFIAGSTPSIFFNRFTTVLIALSPWIFPVYANFYRLVSKVAGERMGLVYSLDAISGELVFPTTIGVAACLSKYADNPIYGLMVGLAATISGYLVGTISFYGLWGILNLKTYRETGFGSFEELKTLPHYFLEVLKGLWENRNQQEQE